MTAVHFTTPAGAQRQRDLAALLLQAGTAGAQLATLARGAGLRDVTARFHLMRMDAAVLAKTAIKYRVRWFHADFAADAAAYVQQQDAVPIHRFGASTARVMAGMAAIEAAGREGLTHEQIGAATGLTHWGASSITRRLRDEGRAVARRTVAPNGYTVLRFYATELAPPQAKLRDTGAMRPSARRKADTATVLRVAGSAGRRHVPERPAQKHELTAPAVSITQRDHGLQLRADAAVTVDPRSAPNPWATAREQHPAPQVPAPQFSAMGPGRYLENDTAIARRYAWPSDARRHASAPSSTACAPC